MQPQPFEIRATDAELSDLAQRLAAVRWPMPVDEGWGFGTDLAWLRELVDFWRSDFDWRAQEDWLQTVLPGQRVRIRDVELHFSHLPGRGPKPFPLLLLHGWPSTFVEMHRIAGPLSDPVAHGGQAEDAFDVVVGTLPGHGFSTPFADPLYGADEMADCFRDLMVDVLGFDRFGAHGGDRGAFVTTGLAHRHPEYLAAIHQNLPMGIAAPERERTPEESAWLSDVARWQAEEGGYSAEQSTRPLSLAYGLADSPVGLAGWICEKFHAWSDCGGDPLSRFTREELLTTVMIYWLSRTIYPSMRCYRAHRMAPPAAVRPDRIEVPTGVALFPGEVMQPPRSAVERKYRLEHWSEMDSGGHFPALEEPAALIADLRAFFRGYR